MRYNLFDLCLFGSVAFDVLVMGGILLSSWGRVGEARPWRVTTPRFLAALAAVAAAGSAKCVIVAVVTHSVFPLMNLAYVTLGASLPLIGLVVLLASAMRPAGQPAFAVSPWVKVIGTLLLVPGLMAAHATFVAPYQLKLETPTLHLPGKSLGDKPITIAILADIQTDRVSAYEHGAVDRAMAEKPDLVLLPGDLFQNRPSEWEAQTPALRELLGKLHAPGGVFMVLGNVDRREPLERIIEGTDVRLLVNETITTSVRNTRLHLGGVELNCGEPRAQATMKALSDMGEERDIRLLLAHVPDAALLIGEGSRIDLVVAGHTHGGQVVIPGFGPPVTFTQVPRNVAAGGLHDFPGCHLYVSRGIGCERGLAPRVRFGCPPEITLLTLVP